MKRSTRAIRGKRATYRRMASLGRRTPQAKWPSSADGIAMRALRSLRLQSEGEMLDALSELRRGLWTVPWLLGRTTWSCKKSGLHIGYAASQAYGCRYDLQRRRISEMNSRVAAGGSVRGERWRWLLYVAMAFAGALLTFVGARAQQKATDQATFQSLIDAYCAAWSTLDAHAPAKFYAKEEGLIFYDIAPFSYHGWKEYHDGVQKGNFRQHGDWKSYRRQGLEG